MKKYILLFLIVAVGVSQIVPSMEVFSENTSSTSRYIKSAEKLITKYITRLKNAGFSDANIASSLEQIRTSYAEKKSDTSYSGTKKMIVDSILTSLDTKITAIQTSSP